MNKISEPMYALVVVIVLTVTLLVATDASAMGGSPKQSHKHVYPPLGQYSIPGVCETRHDSTAAVVTLKRGERMEDALLRMPAVGGVLEIPAGNGLGCDSLTMRTQYSGGITIRGVDSFWGGRSKYYCRTNGISESKGKDFKYQLGGYIPHDDVPGFWLYSGGNSVLIENLEIDGYKGAVKLGSNGQHVIRNSYMHHGPQNGISSVNTGGPNKDPYKGIENYSRFSLEMCGSEISHYGRGNHTHNLYMHRGLGGGGEDPYWKSMGAYDTWSEITLVDNSIHSAGWASGFKSIANKNVVINNVFYSNNDEKPLLHTGPFHTQMMIDVPACSTNIVKGNIFRNFKPGYNASAGGGVLIGLRSRRTAMRGCDIPLVWYPYTNPDSAVPLAKDPNHPIHTNAWWESQNGRIWFESVIEDNLFSTEGEYSNRPVAIEQYSTRWLFEGPKKRSCLLPQPDAWYERSRLTLKNNTFEGFEDGKVLKVVERLHSAICPNPDPTGEQL